MKILLSIYNTLIKFDFLKTVIESLRDFFSFRRYKKRGYFSQHKEDLYLKKYFGDCIGKYLDIGANHPFRISNTYLLYSLGWSGVVVEPIPTLIKAHQKFRPRDLQLPLAVSNSRGELEFFELSPSVLSTFDSSLVASHIRGGGKVRMTHKIEVQTLADISKQYFNNVECDLMSIDTEGFDYLVLSGNNWNSFRPKVIVFESNDYNDNQADDLLLSKGYELLETFGCNKIYRDDMTTDKDLNV